MKKILLIFIVTVFVCSCKKTFAPPEKENPSAVKEDTSNLQTYTNKTITIVNWNIEWFGSPAFGGNLDLQEENAGKIMKSLNADFYGICEVVDTARFGRMIRNTLGSDYKYAISPYLNVQQKLAFVYNKHIFRNVQTRAFMGLSTAAAYNFSSGRFPFLLNADVVVNDTRQKFSAVLLHAKAFADGASYNKRLNGAIEMKDSLDRYFQNKNFVIIGDFNDNFNGSITAGKSSPYKNFIDDTQRYTAFTLPLNTFGYSSTISYRNSVIDQQIGSKAMAKYYISSSVKIVSDLENVVKNYNSGNTSDHYPVLTKYYFQN